MQIPSLLKFLSSNTPHVDYAQRIFEVGPCERLNGGDGDKIETISKLAAATAHANARFTEIRTCLDALLKSLGMGFKVQSEVHPSFVEGRCGSITVNGRHLGVVVELHHIVIVAWGLDLALAAFELEMAGLKT